MSDHDNDDCPHLVRASLLEAENARLKAEVERLKQENNKLAVMVNPVVLKALIRTKEWNAAKEGKPNA